ncbi:hypothetical protein HNP37_004673 [Flavobacterium nitrogenifigens]|uniref:Uncharacterized protein n=2 Tax=Flavobacterium TaxID=237 RepID=A0A7W7J1K8_9FLAO|nr:MULTISPECIES: hypothetical protein [Flavobacterium]MBB4804576.1 hypothetical protein [Flavobacterium nitrogenifigens]MBB6389535.1 hypothetical protein [Flavobacterium notoginsengisoli]
MKNLTLILGICLLISCSNEKESPSAASDDYAMKLLRTPDKSNFSKDQWETIVHYLDNHPEKGSLLSSSQTSSKAKPSGKMAAVSNLAPDDPLNATVEPWQGSVDPYASVDVLTFGQNLFNLRYQWTIARQIADVYTIQARENIVVVDLGERYIGPYDKRVRIQSITEGSSFIVGVHGSISWTQLDHDNIPGLYGAQFFVSGLLSGIGITRQITNSRYANMTAILQSGGYYSNF